MNTFSLIALGWLLYLAVNGKLAEFLSLATDNVLVPPSSEPTKRSAPLPTLQNPSVK